MPSPRGIAPAWPALVERVGEPRQHADRHVVLVRRAEARAGARRVGVVGVAAGRDPRAVALAVVGAVEAQRAAQERERRDDARGAARRGLAEQQRVAAVAGRAEAALAGEEELAVDARRLRLLVHELRLEELRVVGLVPDRPQPDAVAVAAPDRGRERLELLRARLGDVVLLARRRPLRHRAGERELDGDPARRGGGEQGVERVPRPGRVGGGIGGVEGGLRLRLRQPARSSASRRARGCGRRRRRGSRPARGRASTGSSSSRGASKVMLWLLAAPAVAGSASSTRRHDDEGQSGEHGETPVTPPGATRFGLRG